MVTLKDAIVARKCRTGKADGTTKRGAYWLACDPIQLRSTGGDGIGNSAADVSFFLLLRHYRSGEVQASVLRQEWHQNYGTDKRWQTCPTEVLDSTSAEAVIVALKGVKFDGDDGFVGPETVFSDLYTDNVERALADLGLPAAESSPDEVTHD